MRWGGALTGFASARRLGAREGGGGSGWAAREARSAARTVTRAAGPSSSPVPPVGVLTCGVSARPTLREEPAEDSSCHQPRLPGGRDRPGS
jgi:hypothetical protein